MQSRHRSLVLAACLSVVAPLAAAPLTFDFADPKGVNNVQFHIDAPLESVSGQGTGLAGTVTFDPTAPAATTGRIVLKVASLTVGNPKMAEHLQSPLWLDGAGHPEIVFEARALGQVSTQGDTTRAQVAGVLTIKGIVKEIVVPVSFTYLPGKLGVRLNKPELKGDLLVMRAAFSIQRSEFGINPGKHTDKVAERIDLTLALAGAAPQ